MNLRVKNSCQMEADRQDKSEMCLKQNLEKPNRKGIDSRRKPSQVPSDSGKTVQPGRRETGKMKNDDEEVEMEELEEVEAELEEYEDEKIPEWEDEDEWNEKLPTWSNKFEDGPPKLTDEELETVDNQSRSFEIERLEGMGVLKRLQPDADKSKYKFLSTTVVYDWRHRENRWQRRGRLVAREYKWLTNYDLVSLFSPTGVASTIKMLSALFVSTEGYSLGSIDVSDAYLQVEQVEPTIVTVGEEDFELGFTLPGQRIGSSAWFGKLQGILEEYGLERQWTTRAALSIAKRWKSGNDLVVPCG